MKKEKKNELLPVPSSTLGVQHASPASDASAVVSLESLLNQGYSSTFHKLARNIANQHSMDTDDIQDLYQDALMSLFEKIERGTVRFESLAKMEGYLFACMKNMANSAHKYAAKWRSTDFSVQDYALGMDSYEASEYSEVNEPGQQKDFYHDSYEGHDSSEEKYLAPSCSLKEGLNQLMRDKKMSPQAIKVMNIGVLESSSNKDLALLMDYKDEAFARKKKSQHLVIFSKARR